jgi:hypothetical protein
MTTERRRGHPAGAARVLVAGLASASTLGLTAGMAVDPAVAVSPPSAAETAVSPGVWVMWGGDLHRLSARPAQATAASAPARSRTRGS